MTDPVARTTSGAVRGFLDEDANVFLGIPYAAPPLGPHRFAAPVAPEPWDGVREALRYGPTAPQRDPGFTIIPEPVERGDDFLNLNVFTPDPGDARLPVMVWIHGGGFVSGCNRSPWYRGTRFARDGVVVVTIGYRLGVEGFLDVEGAPPNRALLDMIFALEWVRDNIAGFGGDPGAVTIAGQSAGSAACVTLLTNPRAEGLFRRVIAMSGTSDTRMPREASAELAASIAGHLGVPPTREELSVFTPDALIDAYVAVGQDPFGGDMTSFDPRRPGLRPFVDGDVIPEHPYKAIAAGAGKDVPVLAGSTTEEINAVSRMRGGGDEAAAARALEALRITGERLERYMRLVGTDDVVSAYAQAATDRSFRAPLGALLEDRTRASAPCFGYQFAWRSPVFDGAAGAVHCLDVPFAFDNLDADRVSDGLHGPNPPRELADAMHRSFVGFVTDGDPGWPAYDPAARLMMRFDTDPDVEADPLGYLRELFG